MKIIEVKIMNFIYKLTQLEDMTEEEVIKALDNGTISFYLNDIYTNKNESRYKLNVDKNSDELILIDVMCQRVILRGIKKIRHFMIECNLGSVVDIIELDK